MELIFILDEKSLQDKEYKDDYAGYYKDGKAYVLLFNIEASNEINLISIISEFILHEITHAILDIPELDEYDIYRYYEEVIVQKFCEQKLDDLAKRIIEETTWTK